MKVFLDIDGFVFVIGLSHLTVSKLISSEYRDSGIKGEQYISKIIQAPIIVPEWNSYDIKNLMLNLTEKIEKKYSDVLSKNIDLIAKNIEPNPREIKRFINNFMLSSEIFSENTSPVELLVVLVFKSRWPEFYRHFSSNHDFRQLIKEYTQLSDRERESRLKRRQDDNSITESEEKLKTMTDPQLWKLLRDKTDLIFGINNWENYRRAVEVIKEDLPRPSEMYLKKLLYEENIDEFNKVKRLTPHPVNLRQENLSGKTLDKVDLEGADLQEARFIRTSLIESRFRETRMHEVNLEGANLSGAKLDCANLTESNLIRTRLDDASLNEAKLQNSWMISAKLHKASLVDASLEGSYLIWANLQDADLRGADLRYANLTNSVLIGANLSNANLVGANLSDATLRGANLAGADFEDADISTAHYVDEDIVGVVKNLDRAIRNAVRIDPMFEELCNTIKSIGGRHISHVAIFDNRRQVIYESTKDNNSDVGNDIQIMQEMGWIHWQVKREHGRLSGIHGKLVGSPEYWNEKYDRLNLISVPIDRHHVMFITAVRNLDFEAVITYVLENKINISSGLPLKIISGFGLLEDDVKEGLDKNTDFTDHCNNISVLNGVLYVNIFDRGGIQLSAAKALSEPEGINQSVHKALKLRTLREKYEYVASTIRYVVVQYQKTKRIAIYFGDYLLYIVTDVSADYKIVIKKAYGG